MTCHVLVVASVGLYLPSICGKGRSGAPSFSTKLHVAGADESIDRRSVVNTRPPHAHAKDLRVRLTTNDETAVLGKIEATPRDDTGVCGSRDRAPIRNRVATAVPTRCWWVGQRAMFELRPSIIKEEQDLDLVQNILTIVVRTQLITKLANLVA